MVNFISVDIFMDLHIRIIVFNTVERFSLLFPQWILDASFLGVHNG